MKKRVCPICGNESYDYLDKIRLLLPKEYHLPEEYYIVHCKTCGFCFSDTSATADDYNNYYSKCNTYSGTPVGMEEWNWIYEPAEKMVKPYINLNSHLIDMGFGKGIFLKWLEKRGYANILGIDPSPESVKAIEKDGIHAIEGNIFNPAEIQYQKTADCVFLFDVLEHLLFPYEAISTLKTYMKENCYFLISVPNYAYLKENNNPIVNMFNQEHINYFSIISLNNLLEKCGFRLIQSNETDDNEEIIALYQLNDKIKNKILEKDNICIESIKEYLDRFKKRRLLIEKKLSALKEDNIKEIYVWGTGAFTMWLLNNTILGEFKINFIDNNVTKIGKKIDAHIIISPNSIDNEEKPILVSSMLYAENICTQIKTMNIANEVIVL